MASIPIFIQENVALRNLTSFKVGGAARYFAEPTTIEELREILAWRKEQNQKQELPYFVLGRGSNLVIADMGYPGLIIHLGKSFAKISLEGERMLCQAGAQLHTAVSTAVEVGLAGIENLGGIPGTLGGGAFINAGAYDQELCQVIESVRTIDIQGAETIRTNAECEFSYRHSGLMNRQEIIVEVTLHLRYDEPQRLRTQMNSILLKRREKQPLELPNAGSMFKRPPGKFAGSLIEASGLKGLRVGDAQISEKHANFVVNLGSATSADIWNLTEQVIHIVQRDHGVTLEREVIFLQ